MSTTVEEDVLAAVYARAGASDQDREAWLAERRTGITATEVRDLYLEAHGFPVHTTRRELLDRKLGRVPEVGDLSSVPVIGWGKLREPVIAAELQRRFGMLPESRVFRAVDDPRKLASPDGLGVGFFGELEVSEIKTAGMDIAPGTDAYERKGYLAQKVWVMRVIGARRALYAHEYRLDGRDGNQFEPGLLRTWWIEWTPEVDALAEELEQIADAFLADLDRERAEGPAEKVIDEEIDTLAVNYLRGLDLEKDGAELKVSSYKALEARMPEGPFKQSSALANVSWSPAVFEDRPVTATDVGKARAADPGLYERYELALDELQSAMALVETEKAAVDAHEARFTTTSMVPVEVKRKSLRVTAAKVKEEQA